MRKAAGRPVKVDYKTMERLADALQHSATVSDACRWADISRDTYYRHCRNEPIFADRMRTAKTDQYKLTNFLTIY